MVNFPASLDTGSTLPNPTTSSTTNSPSHAGLHGNENAAIIAAETKIGIGATVPASNTLLVGTGAGTSAWQGLTSAQLAAILSDETGSGSAVFATTPTLVTPKVDTINESTPGNGTTIGGVNIKSGFMSGANLTAGTVGNSQVATGVCVQVASSVTGAVATGTTVLPLDDTIPQITEGDQYLSVSITPKASTNSLLIEVNVFVSCSATRQMGIALFQDSTANALSATELNMDTATAEYPGHLLHPMTAGTTSSTTFKVRIGPATAGTTTLNGSSGGRTFGGVANSSIVVTEYKV